MYIRREELPRGVDENWERRTREMIGEPVGDDDRAENVRKLTRIAIDGLGEARERLLDEHVFLSQKGAFKAMHAEPGLHYEEGVEQLRQKGAVLAVPDHGRLLYPIFQFIDGKTSLWVPKVHNKFRKRSGSETPSPWSELSFWSMRRDVLGGRALKSVVALDEYQEQIAYVVKNARV